VRKYNVVVVGCEIEVFTAVRIIMMFFLGPLSQRSLPLTLIISSTSQHRHFGPEGGDVYFCETLASTYDSAWRRNPEQQQHHCSRLLFEMGVISDVTFVMFLSALLLFFIATVIRQTILRYSRRLPF
jgi:hypothetical protein